MLKYILILAASPTLAVNSKHAREAIPDFQSRKPSTPTKPGAANIRARK